MTWEQKFAAILSIGDAALRMRKPGDWYVDHRGVEVKERQSSCMIVSR
jgi:hypothetical protein